MWTLPVNGNPPGDIKNTFNPIYTAVPALTIAPDARGGGMGDIGAATTPDVHSQYWNPAKYAFHYSKAGVSLSYTPWLRKIVNDVAMAYVSGFYKLGDNDQQAIGTSLRYFSLGEIAMTEYGGAVYNQVSPYEMAFDVSYSRKLSESYSMAVALRYIRSDMGAGVDDDIQAGNAFSADVAGYLNKYVVLGSSECLWALGFNISNIGTKVSYDGVYYQPVSTHQPEDRDLVALSVGRLQYDLLQPRFKQIPGAYGTCIYRIHPRRSGCPPKEA